MTSGSVLAARIALVLSSCLYAAVLHIGHAFYLYPAWGYYGFSFSQPDIFGYVVMFATVTVGAMVLPLRIARPSSIILLLLYLIVYVPTMALTPALRPGAASHYFDVLAALTAGFTVCCVVGRREMSFGQRAAQPDSGFIRLILITWLCMFAVLLFNYAAIMTFAGLDEVYAQREAGRAANPAMAYIQTYFALIFSPALIAIGLVKKRYLILGLGIAGCMIIYMINAQRTIFLLPIAMVALSWALGSRMSFMRLSGTFVVGFSAMIAASTLVGIVAPSSPFAVYFQFRTLGLPGLTYSQYFDVFQREGFTFWSHVKGISLLVPPPLAFAHNDLWPGLGYLIGEEVYANPTNNQNGNLFAGDGAAAAGWLGVIVISVVFAAWIALLDSASRGWDKKFVILISVPMVLSLTNGHFSTMLLSFGGIFWLAVLRFWKHLPDTKPIGEFSLPMRTSP